jgi:hypothetical protein
MDDLAEVFLNGVSIGKTGKEPHAGGRQRGNHFCQKQSHK